MLNKNELLKIKLKVEKVKLHQGFLNIKEFTTSDREAFEVLAMNIKRGNAKNLKSRLIALSVVDERGSRMFGDDEIATISQLPSTITEKLFNEILKLNGMNSDAIEEEKGN